MNAEELRAMYSATAAEVIARSHGLGEVIAEIAGKQLGITISEEQRRQASEWLSNFVRGGK